MPKIDGNESAERGSSGGGLMPSIERAHADAVDLYAYLTRHARTVEFSPLLSMSPGKIAEDPGLTSRLFELATTLARAAAPVTPKQARVSLVLTGERSSGSPEVNQLASAIRHSKKLFVYLCIWLGLSAALSLFYTAYGEYLIGKAGEVRHEAAELLTEWQKAALTIRSSPAPDLLAKCASRLFASDASDLFKDTHILDLCRRTGDVIEQRSENDRSLALWRMARSQPDERLNPLQQDDVLQLAAMTGSEAGRADGRISIFVALIIPLLFGALGATLHMLRSYDGEKISPDWESPLRVWTTIIVGAAFGFIAAGFVGSEMAVAKAFLAFLLGYFAPQFFVLLDSTTGLVSTAGSEQRNWPKLSLLRPVSHTTHFTIGAVLVFAFLVGCLFLPGAPRLSLALPAGFNPPQQSTMTIPFLTLIGGSLGAWAKVTSDIFYAVSSARKEDVPRVSLPLFRYVTGAFGGFVASFVVPSALLLERNSMAVFNPFLLSGLSLVAGYLCARYASLVIGGDGDSVVAAGGVLAVEEGVRRALAPPPLVNYKGYLNYLLRNTNLELSMVERKAILTPGTNEYLLEINLGPDSQDKAASVPIQIDDGVDGPEAVFDVEITAFGFTPRRRRIRIASKTSTQSNSEQLRYRVDSESSEEGSRFRLNVYQAGRLVQLATLDAQTMGLS
jgi:hypothetical protein